MRIARGAAPAGLRLPAPRHRLAAPTTLVAVLVLVLALGTAASVTAAPARSARVATDGDRNGNLIVTGSRTARRGDEFVLYLARRCASTIRAARRGNYVIASGKVDKAGRERFRAMIADSEVTPRRGRACFLLADSRRRTRLQTSAAYRMG